jgi:hypothetical protein
MMTTSTDADDGAISQIEFGLEKAEHGMALPYDAERVGQLRKLLVEARKRKVSAGLAERRKHHHRAAMAARPPESGGEKWETMMNEEDCLGARFEILLDGKTQYCRDTLITAMGAANIIQGQNPKSRVAVRDLQTGQLTAIPTPATQT